jgi:hypothetical protein
MGLVTASARPSERAPGRNTAGRNAPGRNAPGSTATGRSVPGRIAAGRTAAGRIVAGRLPLPATVRPLAVTGAIAACVVMLSGLVIILPLVLAGWIAAPHDGLGLPGVLRTTADIWLAAHHVQFSLSGAGRIGLLPLGLVLLPGALLWRAGKWVVRTGQVSRLRHVGYAALALAGPYGVLSGALALASRSALAAASLPEAVLAGFGLGLVAGGLGGARALAPWGRLTRLLSPRPASVIQGTVGSLVVLAGAGALVAGASLAAHLGQFRSLTVALAPGLVGSALLLLAQLAYLPNAIGWAVCYTLGPGFAFGTGTVIAPTGSAIGLLPSFPMLAALPGGSGGLHASVPAWVSLAVLVVPSLAGGFGGLLTVRAAPALTFEAAPLWGFGSGALAGVITGVLAALSGGPLGSERLAAVGPSGWQASLVAVLEVGVSAAVTAGFVNWLRLRRNPEQAAGGGDIAAGSRAPGGETDDGHRIYLDPWAGEEDEWPDAPRPGPASLP